jgi:hypothetical protein
MKKNWGIFCTVFILFFSAHAAFTQCRSDDLASPDTTSFHNDPNVDLSDYGVIFDDAAPWSGCTQFAADALYRKVYTTFHPQIVGLGGWPHNDGSAGQVPFNYYQYQGWLQGASVGLIYATALRLSNVGKLTKPLDDLIQHIPYTLNIPSTSIRIADSTALFREQ